MGVIKDTTEIIAENVNLLNKKGRCWDFKGAYFVLSNWEENTINEVRILCCL